MNRSVQKVGIHVIEVTHSLRKTICGNSKRCHVWGMKYIIRAVNMSSVIVVLSLHKYSKHFQNIATSEWILRRWIIWSKCSCSCANVFVSLIRNRLTILQQCIWHLCTSVRTCIFDPQLILIFVKTNVVERPFSLIQWLA